MMLDNKDITVVVQGPVQTLPDREQDVGITKQCLDSVRHFLPGSTIILSTWEDQDLSGLDYDELVINQDPGSNIREYKPDGSPLKMNNNRQIASSLGGLKAVKTKYAMKLRSDNYLSSDAFKDLFSQYQDSFGDNKFFNGRVVTANIFTREYNKGKKVLFHLSDFFYFGLTEDLLSIWDIPYIADIEYDSSKKGKTQHPGFPMYRTDCTQLLWTRALEKHTSGANLLHLHDCDKSKKVLSDQIYANNLIVASPNEVGLGLCSKFLGTARASRRSGIINFMSYTSWQRLYKKYANPQHKIKNDFKDRISMLLWRLILVYPKRFEDDLKIARRRITGK